MAGPLILAYNLDGEALDRLRGLCDAQGLTLRVVSPWEYGAPVGALAGIPVARQPENGPGVGFGDPMLLMCHLLSPQLDAFLQGMRDHKVPRIALKAILTPHNVTWTSRQLRDELAREHEAVQQGRKREHA